MKKTLALVLSLTVLMVMLLAACGTDDSMTTNPESGLNSSTSDTSSNKTSESDPLGGLLDDEDESLTSEKDEANSDAGDVTQ